MRWMTFAVLLLLVLPSVSWAQDPNPYPTSVPGPEKNPSAPQPVRPSPLPLEPAGVESAIDSEVAIGDQAPDFVLDGSQGRPVHLADLKGQWAVMVFTETRTTLAPLKGIDGELVKLGARLYGICKDGVPALKSYAEREQLPFLLLSDLTGQISQIYGMYDTEHDTIQTGFVLVDPQGVVRMAILGPSLHADEVLQLVKHTVIGA
jgi:peroxiredoxin